MKVAKNKVVTIEYTLTDPSGEVLDTSRGGEPLSYLHGAGGIIEGLESALDGKAPGESLNVTVEPARGYGEKDPSLVQAVPRSMFKGAPSLEVGMQFEAQTQAGRRMLKIVEVAEETVTVDANHPLAGVPLTFEVSVLRVRNATAEEVSHGHAHGEGGHHHH